MDRDLLYRFFEAKTTDDQENEIRAWFEASEENKRIFFKERMIYDAIILNSSENLNNKTKSSTISLWKMSTVAAVVLLLIISGLYFFDLKNSPEQFNTIIVPPGQRINLILADQTNVWLNANTKFEYPAQFSKKNRTVRLDGEAYFDVTKNEKAPFIIQTELGEVQVTGTKFNLEAYSRMGTFATSLFEGGVDIYRNEEKVVSLKPNEKSIFKNEQFSVTEITDTDEFLWRRGLIAFNNKKLEEILSSLEKYFDIDIKISPENLPQCTYSGKFRQSDGVDYALRVLQKSIRFSYERDDETNTIHIK